MSTSYRWLEGNACATFAFGCSITSSITFHIENQRPLYDGDRPPKRRRPLWDVDGSPTLGKKKRRLRLNLITSRLSRPFSLTKTNVADHGVKKVAVWNTELLLKEHDLRKVAIINCLRRRIEKYKADQALMSWMPSVATETYDLRRNVLLAKTQLYRPLPPSPLSISDYNALDLEEEEELTKSNYSELEESFHPSMKHCRPSCYEFGVVEPLGLLTDYGNHEFLGSIDGNTHGQPGSLFWEPWW